MKRIHYAWLLVAAGFLILGCSAGQLINCYSLLVVPVCEELGIPRSAMGLSQSLINTGGIIVPLFAGRIFQHFKLKRMMTVSAALMLASYFSISLAQNIWHIWASVICLSFTQALVTWMPFSIILNNWFVKKRGLAIGVAYMGSGVGGMIFSTLGGVIISALGWRAMVQIYTLICALIVLPVLIFIVREKPEDAGLLPYGLEAGDQAEQAAQDESGLSFADECKKPRLWILMGSVVLLGFAINGFSTTMAAYTQDSGYSGEFAANVMAGYMGSLAVGKILLGMLYDKLGARRATGVSVAALVVCYASLLMIRMPAMFAGVILGSGVGIAFGTVAFPILARHTFGNRDYSVFTGWFIASNNIGGAFSPTIFGAVCDWLGSYSYAYMGAIAFVIVFGSAIILCVPEKKAA